MGPFRKGRIRHTQAEPEMSGTFASPRIRAARIRMGFKPIPLACCGIRGAGDGREAPPLKGYGFLLTDNGKVCIVHRQLYQNQAETDGSE